MIKIPIGWKQITKRPIKSTDYSWDYENKKYTIVGNSCETLNMMVRDENFHSVIVIRSDDPNKLLKGMEK